MARSELFLLLPVYGECVWQPDYIKRMDLMSEAKIRTFMERIDDIVNFFAIENTACYYDSENIKAFLYPIRILEDSYPNAITRMRTIMTRWGENWRNEKRQKESEIYMYDFARIQDDTLCEMAERKIVASDGSTYLLINHNALLHDTERLDILSGGEAVTLCVRAAEIKDIACWFESNRRPHRTFNLNPKHGECGRGAYPSNKGQKVSVLMCTRDEASEMLNKAIGQDLDTLYYYDTNNKRYIEFKHERGNAYHAFHLDLEDECRIPAKVKMNIKKLI